MSDQAHGSPSTPGVHIRDVIVVDCPACQARFAVRAKYAGHRVACPHCEQGLNVPETAHRVTAVTCGACQHEFAVPADYNRDKIRCPKCLQFHEVPRSAATEKKPVAAEQPLRAKEIPPTPAPSAPEPAPEPQKAASASKQYDTARFLHCEKCDNTFPINTEDASRGFRCPKCANLIHDGYYVRQEKPGKWHYHTSLFGGIRSKAYESRSDAVAAVIKELLKKKTKKVRSR